MSVFVCVILTTLQKSVGISDEQLKVLQRLRRLPEIDTTASTAKILDSISLVLTDSAKALKRRVKSSGYGAEGSKRCERGETMTHTHTHTHAHRCLTDVHMGVIGPVVHEPNM